MNKILYIPSGTYLIYSNWKAEELIQELIRPGNFYDFYKEKYGIPINVVLNRNEFEIIYD